MAAGSVRLPELKQDIKVDTKDLVRAEAAAKRFKQAMNRNLQIDDSEFDKSLASMDKKLDAFTSKNRELTVDAKIDLDKARKDLEEFLRDRQLNIKADADTAEAQQKLNALTDKTVTVTVDADTALAREKIQAIRDETVTVRVVASTVGFKKDLQAKLAGLEAKVKVEPNTVGFRKAVREKLAGLSVSARVDPNTVGFARKVREKLVNLRVWAQVEPKTAGFQRALREKLKELDLKVTVQVDADTSLARAKIAALTGQTVRVKVDVDVDDARRRIDELARSARASVADLDRASGGLNRMSRNSRLAARALGMLSIAGIVGGGIGVLAAGAIAAAGALHSAAPAALALTGALGGLGVAAGGLVAIFKSNEGLKGSSKILRDAFQGIQDDLQRRVNPSILDFMRSVAGLAPIAREMVPPFAQAFNEVTQGFSRMLRDSTFQADLRKVIQDGIVQFRFFGEGAKNAIEGIMSLAAATGPYINRLAMGFRDTTAEFRDWVREARRTGELNQLLNTSFQILTSLGRTVRDLAVGFKNMFRAADFSGFTITVLGTLEAIAGDFRRFTAERQADMQAMFANLGAQFAGFRNLIGSLANGIREILTNIDLLPLMRGIQAIIPELARALTQFTNSLARVAQEAAPAINSLLSLITAILPNIERVVTTVVQNVTQVVNAVRPGVERLTLMLANIGDNVIPVIAGAARNLGQAFSALMPIIAPIGEFLGGIVGLLGDMSGAAGIALAAMLGFGALRGVFGGAAQGASRLWTGINNLASGTARTGQRVGVLRGAMQGLLRPFAQGVVGTQRLGSGLAALSGQIRTQTALAHGYRATLTRTGAALAALSVSQSGVLRAIGAAGDAMVRANTQATRYATQMSNNAGRIAASFERGMAVPVTASLTRLGGALQTAGVRMTGLAGNASTAGQQLAARLGNALITTGGSLNRFSTFVTTVSQGLANQLGRGASTAVGFLSRLDAGAAAVARGGFTAMYRGVSGLVNALGGMAGVAITGVIAGLTLMGQRAQENAQKQQQFRDALAQAGGQIDDNVQKMAQANLEQANLAAGADALGVSQSELADVFTKGGPEAQAYIDRLNDMAGVYQYNIPILNEVGANLGQVRGKYAELADAAQAQIDTIRIQTDLYNEQQRTLTQNNSAMSASERASRQMKTGFDEMGKSAGDADKFVAGLTKALDGISGRSQSADEANAAFGESLREMARAAQEGAGGLQILNGDLNEQSEVGKRAFDSVMQLREATLQKAAADFQAAGGTSNLQAAQAAANGALQQGKQAMVDNLTQMGANRQEAQRYADQLFAIPPEVLTRILADPANAERIVAEWQAGVRNPPGGPPAAPFTADPKMFEAVVQEAKNRLAGAPPAPAPVGADPRAFDEAVRQKMEELKNAPPAPAPVGGDTGPLAIVVAEAKRRIEGAPPMPAPVGADPTAFDQAVRQKMDELRNAAPTPAPVGGDTNPLDKDVGTAQGNIEGAPPAALPVGGNLLVEQQVQAFVARLNAFQAAILPVNANVQPGEQQALAWVARINAYPAALLPINANVVPGEQQALAWVARINGFQGAMLPIGANIDQLNQQYNQAFTFITRTVIIAPIGGNIDQLNQLYNQAYTFISRTIIIAPVSGDFTALVDEYSRIAITIQTTPLYIPIYGQFMGIQGLPGGGGMGMAAGGILANEKGRMAEFFAEGGMSAKDKATLGMVANQSAQNERKYPNGGGSLGDMATARGMGLKPMAANQASIVAPNTWRVIGDRARDDESYIPINRSPRSVQILEETAKRMGFALEQFAQGGFHSGPTANQGNTGQEPRTSAQSAAASSVTNHNEAPLIGGDLSIVVPQDTPVQDAFSEAMFQLRRVKRGGVHRRTPAQTGR